MSKLFGSLAFYMAGMDEDQIRERIVEHLLSNSKDLEQNPNVKEILEWKECDTLAEYVEKFLKTNEWGGALEITAFCDVFYISVHVYHDSQVVKFTPSIGRHVGEIHLGFNKVHYSPLNSIIHDKSVEVLPETSDNEEEDTTLGYLPAVVEQV